MAEARKPRRTRVESGIYRQPNGKYAVCARRAGRLHFRTASGDLITARRAREDLIAALEAGAVFSAPSSRHRRRHTLEQALRGDGGRGRAPPAHL